MAGIIPLILRQATWVIVLALLTAGGAVRANEPAAQILSTQVLCKQPGRYIGWPTITRTRAGELLVVFSGDRDEHVCPWGKTQMIRSADDGRTWSAVTTVNSTPLDDRDAGVIETAPGTLVVSWFTSLGFTDPRVAAWYPHLKTESWRRHIEKLSPETRAQWLGYWIRRSEDGGKTWGEPVRSHVTAPHGPIQLADKRLLYVGMSYVGLTHVAHGQGERTVIGVDESRDDGRSWRLIATVPIPADEKIEHYHEPHLVETSSGKLVALFRYEPEDRAQCFLRQSESADGGRTWSTARKTPIWGYPPHLIRLHNGWLLAVYGRRTPPFSQRACLSRDEGRTWETAHELTLASAPNSDMGYPASAQLADGSIWTVFYQIDQQGEQTCLMGTHWRLR